MMLSEFIESWELFAESYLLGLALSALLPLIGIIVILRKQLFIAAAISQSSILGMAFGLWAHFLTHNADILTFLNNGFTVLLFSFLASLLCIRSLKQTSGQREIATVLVFVLSTSIAFLLLAHSPFGLKEVQERMSSSLISSSINEFYICITILCLLALFWYFFYRPIILVCTDPETAEAMGWPVITWEFILSSIIGLGIGWAVHLSGWLHTFGLLLLPVFIARVYCKSIFQVLFVAPILGVTISFISYIIAHKLNVPFSQIAIASHGAIYIFSTLVLSKFTR